MDEIGTSLGLARGLLRDAHKQGASLPTWRFLLLCGILLLLVGGLVVVGYEFAQDKQRNAALEKKLAEIVEQQAKDKKHQEKDRQAVEDLQKQNEALKRQVGEYKFQSEANLKKIDNAHRYEEARIKNEFAKLLEALGGKQVPSPAYGPRQDKLRVPPELQKDALDASSQAVILKEPECTIWTKRRFFCDPLPVPRE